MGEEILFANLRSAVCALLKSEPTKTTSPSLMFDIICATLSPIGICIAISIAAFERPLAPLKDGADIFTSSFP